MHNARMLHHSKHVLKCTAAECHTWYVPDEAGLPRLTACHILGCPRNLD